MNRIHHTAIIGDDVEFGEGNVVGPYAVVVGKCVIGDENWIGPHVVVGTPAEMRGTHHAAGWDADHGAGTVSIGNRNVVREFTAVHQGTTRGTSVGDDCYIMNKVYIPHDCQVGNSVTVSCGVMIGGHVVLGDGCNLGLGATLHQRIVVGEGSMIGMGSVVTRHMEPYALAYGSPARVCGANKIGLERLGADPELIEAIDRAHKDGTGLAALISDEYRRFEDQVRCVTEHS